MQSCRRVTGFAELGHLHSFQEVSGVLTESSTGSESEDKSHGVIGGRAVDIKVRAQIVGNNVKLDSTVNSPALESSP